MADISMCNGLGCKDKDTCFRCLAEPSGYQAYILINRDNNEECDHYWPVNSPEELAQLNRSWRD